MKVYHRTKNKKAAISILENGFKSLKGFYGVGVYTCIDIESVTSSYSRRHYGNTIIECDINLNEHISFEDSISALAYYKANGKNSVTMEYNNKNDGNVLFVAKEEVTPLRYSVDDGKTWRY